ARPVPGPSVAGAGRQTDQALIGTSAECAATARPEDEPQSQRDEHDRPEQASQIGEADDLPFGDGACSDRYQDEAEPELPAQAAAARRPNQRDEAERDADEQGAPAR